MFYFNVKCLRRLIGKPPQNIRICRAQKVRDKRTVSIIVILVLDYTKDIKVSNSFPSAQFNACSQCAKFIEIKYYTKTHDL